MKQTNQLKMRRLLRLRRFRFGVEIEPESERKPNSDYRCIYLAGAPKPKPEICVICVICGSFDSE
jgi:hypothetical protein